MKKVTVAVPYCFEDKLVVGCARQIRRHWNPSVEIEMLIMDQADPQMSARVQSELSDLDFVRFVKVPRIDAGFPLDVAARTGTGDWFCSLDADAFPISDKWLSLPIEMIERHGYTSVGKQTGLHHAYRESLGEYFHINNYYRVMRMQDARDVSHAVGFLRPENHYKAEPHGYTFSENVGISADNGVAVQFWLDRQKRGPKLSLAMNRIIGKTPGMGVYGMVIDDLVFHMVFGQTFEEQHESVLGAEYKALVGQIYRDGLDDSMADRLAWMSTKQNIIDLYGDDNYWGNWRCVYEAGDFRMCFPGDPLSEEIESLKNA